jgi:hypothetical protein
MAKGSYNLPVECNDKVSLMLFADRDIFGNVTEDAADVAGDAACVFDRIVFYDQLPDHRGIIRYRSSSRLDLFNRLGARTNVLKLATLFVSPFKYTLYLDGDTAPCFHFQSIIFHTVSTKGFDIMTTPNPLGYESSKGKTTYMGSPKHHGFASFTEVNGGIVAYTVNDRTVSLFARALELVPWFADTLGYDQDQVMLRHALFEHIAMKGLVVSKEPMRRYCRFG